jgi:hypothetical protein
MNSLRLALLTFLSLSPCLTAATYYVATTGSDGNAGTSDAPFQTLQQAVNTALAGDTVVVRDGTYGHVNAVGGGDASSVEASPVTLYNSGAPGAPIVIKSENQWGAVLDCELICDAYFDLYNSSYIVIQDFVITRGLKEGIHSNDTANNITLQGNRFEYIGNRNSSATYGLDGMYTNPNCHDFVIEGNIFHDIGRTNLNWLDHALYLHGTNFTITNNLFYNIPHGWSIQAADGLSNVLIANNTFAFPQGGGQDGQIMLWNTQSNLTIRNNIFYSPQNYAINRYSSSQNGCTIDHNLVYGAGAMMADTTGCTMDVTQTGVDPDFVNAATAPFDFHLQSNSPAIGGGTAALPSNAAPSSLVSLSVDLGAYSYAAPASLQIANTTQGTPTWSVGDGWTLNITGAAPASQVMLTVGNWSGAVGYSDGSGNFSVSGVAAPGDIGTVNEIWTVGGAMVNPGSIAITVAP